MLSERIQKIHETAFLLFDEFEPIYIEEFEHIYIDEYVGHLGHQ
jgi:hypothetical protein